MSVEILSFVQDYKYFLFSGIIGYILWQKFYKTKNKSLLNNIDSQLEWFNLSLLTFLSCSIFYWTVTSFQMVITNSNNFRNIIDTILNSETWVLGIFLIMISIFLVNEKINSVKFKKTKSRFNTIYSGYILLMFITNALIIGIAFWYHSITDITFVIIVNLIVFGLILLLRGKTLEITPRVIIFLALIIIASLTYSWAFFNKVTLEEQYENKIECSREGCYKEIINKYSHSVPIVNLYNYVYIPFDTKNYNYTEFYTFQFQNNESQPILKLGAENKNQFSIVELDFKKGYLGLYLNESIRNQIKTILLFRKEKVSNNSKYFIINTSISKDKVNLNITTYNLPISFEDYWQKGLGFEEKNCTIIPFYNQKKEGLECIDDDMCDYSEKENRLLINFDLQIENFYIELSRELNSHKNLSLNISIKCNN